MVVTEAPPLPQQGPRTKDSVMASTLIGSHSIEHMYGHGFQVLLPAIYVTFGLAPIEAGLLVAVRQLSSGITSTVSGFFVDMVQHRRGPILAFSMALLGVGYLLVAMSPTYALILAALVFASAGSALWHPPALGLLAQRYPQRRGFMISLHRSFGNIGDTVGPLLVGILLGGVVLWWMDGTVWDGISWRWIAGGMSPLMLVMAIGVLITLRHVGGDKPPSLDVRAKLVGQLANMREAFAGGGMWAIFIVSAIRGMGDRTLVLALPLYIGLSLEDGGLGKGPFWVGFHVALLTAPGIIAGPIFGAVSDKIGRKPLISLIMAVGVMLSLGMVWGDGGIIMTLSVALFGLFHFSVNSLTQASAMDLVAGRQLESTFIGLLWGSNAAFGAIAALLAGVLVGHYGWGIAFYLASGFFLIGFLVSLSLPNKSEVA